VCPYAATRPRTSSLQAVQCAVSQRTPAIAQNCAPIPLLLQSHSPHFHPLRPASVHLEATARAPLFERGSQPVWRDINQKTQFVLLAVVRGANTICTVMHRCIRTLVVRCAYVRACACVCGFVCEYIHMHTNSLKLLGAVGSSHTTVRRPVISALSSTESSICLKYTSHPSRASHSGASGTQLLLLCVRAGPSKPPSLSRISTRRRSRTDGGCEKALSVCIARSMGIGAWR